jgi:hypothetical protein
VDRSSAGYTHEELQAELTLRVHDTLRSLVEDHLIGRARVDQLYVYVSTHRRVAAAQRAQRRAASPAALALPPALDPARTIDVLLAVIQHPGAAPKAIVARLAAKGRLVSLAQVEDLFGRDARCRPRASSACSGSRPECMRTHGSSLSGGCIRCPGG